MAKPSAPFFSPSQASTCLPTCHLLRALWTPLPSKASIAVILGSWDDITAINTAISRRELCLTTAMIITNNKDHFEMRRDQRSSIQSSLCPVHEGNNIINNAKYSARTCIAAEHQSTQSWCWTLRSRWVGVCWHTHEQFVVLCSVLTLPLSGVVGANCVITICDYTIPYLNSKLLSYWFYYWLRVLSVVLELWTVNYYEYRGYHFISEFWLSYDEELWVRRAPAAMTCVRRAEASDAAIYTA